MEQTEEQVTEFENLLRLLNSSDEAQIRLGLHLRRGVRNELLEQTLKETFDLLYELGSNPITEQGCTYEKFRKKSIEYQLRILLEMRLHRRCQKNHLVLNKAVNLSLLNRVIKDVTILEDTGLTSIEELCLPENTNLLQINNNKIQYVSTIGIIESLFLYNCNVKEIRNISVGRNLSITHSKCLDESTLANIEVTSRLNALHLNFTASNVLFGDGLVSILKKCIVLEKSLRRVVINITDTPILHDKHTFRAFLKKLYFMMCEIEATVYEDKSIWRDNKWNIFSREKVLSLVVGKNYNQKKMGGLFLLMEEFKVYISKDYEN